MEVEGLVENVVEVMVGAEKLAELALQEPFSFLVINQIDRHLEEQNKNVFNANFLSTQEFFFTLLQNFYSKIKSNFRSRVDFTPKNFYEIDSTSSCLATIRPELRPQAQNNFSSNLRGGAVDN